MTDSTVGSAHVMKRRTLTFRLLITFLSLLALVIVALGFVTISMLRSYLVHNVDDQLKSTGQVVASKTLANIAKIKGNGSADDVGHLNLSDYYIYVKMEGDTIIVPSPDNNAAKKPDWDVAGPEYFSRQTYQRYGKPKDPGSFASKKAADFETIEGTQFGTQWRAIAFNLNDGRGTTIGTMIIALPLTPVDATVARIAWVIGLSGAAIVIVGAFTALFSIRSSLKPLRGIESATHAIADGDLSRRVPKGQEGSEVGKLADSINVMLEQIEQSFDVKERSEKKMRQFVSDASHELRTPLATVRGYAELYRIGGVPDCEIPVTMDRIESEAQRMSGLVEDLLQLARLDEGRPLSLKDTQLTEIAMNAAMDLRVRDAGRPAAVIGLDGGPAPDITIYADSDKVTQVVTNLLSNVLSHTPAGTPVEIALGRQGEDAVVEVRDHGPGVEPEDSERLFERFFRTDSSRSRASGGSGLGLAIVASVMAAHGGTARISETPGGGLTVRLTFPPVASSTASGGITAAEEAARVASPSETEQKSKQESKPKGIGRFKGSAGKGSANKNSPNKNSPDKNSPDKSSDNTSSANKAPTEKGPTGKGPAKG